MHALKDLIRDVSVFVGTLDLQDAAGAESELEKRFPPQSQAVRDLIESARVALEKGEICDREGEGVRFSRVLKPEEDAGGCSVDAVLMEDSQGPWHTHLEGEVCLLIPLEGQPRFDGRNSTWMVLEKGSRHAPKVEGGRMLILYWWPKGAVKWG